MRKLALALIALGAAAVFAAPALGAPLNIVEVDSPNISCLFGSPCAVLDSLTSSDSVGIGVGGSNSVITQTYTGQPGTPANRFTAYLYQVSMAQAVGLQPETCLTSLTLNFGHVINAFDYNRDGATGDEVFVIRSGRTGSIGLASADKLADEIKFTFSEPICAGSAASEGGASYWFGLVSTQEPHFTTASVRGAPVLRDYDVEVRTPIIETFARLNLRYFDLDGDRRLSDMEFFNAIDMWLTQEMIPGTDAHIDDLTFFRIIDWWVAASPIIFDYEPRAAATPTSKLSFEDDRLMLRVSGQNVEQVQFKLYSTSGELVLSQIATGRTLSIGAQNAAGQPLANGVYLYEIVTLDSQGNALSSEIKKLAVVR